MNEFHISEWNMGYKTMYMDVSLFSYILYTRLYMLWDIYDKWTFTESLIVDIYVSLQY
jgi:hypothetical protein